MYVQPNKHTDRSRCRGNKLFGRKTNLTKDKNNLIQQQKLIRDKQFHLVYFVFEYHLPLLGNLDMIFNF